MESKTPVDLIFNSKLLFLLQQKEARKSRLAEGTWNLGK